MTDTLSTAAITLANGQPPTTGYIITATVVLVALEIFWIGVWLK